MNLYKADTCLKRTKNLEPQVSALDRFYCIHFCFRIANTNLISILRKTLCFDYCFNCSLLTSTTKSYLVFDGSDIRKRGSISFHAVSSSRLFLHLFVRRITPLWRRITIREPPFVHIRWRDWILINELNGSDQSWIVKQKILVSKANTCIPLRNLFYSRIWKAP